MPTYNFCVVVDDRDMRITPRDPRRRPRQQHAAADQHLQRARRAAAACSPRADDPRRGRRRSCRSATARSASRSTEDEGYLPEAMLNYLARLGWSHGDDEIFTREQMVEWFDGSHLSKSPAQLDAAKLAWVNAQYLKAGRRRAPGGARRRAACARAASTAPADAAAARASCALFKDRCSTTVELADWLRDASTPTSRRAPTTLAQHVTDAVRPALATLARRARGRRLGQGGDRRRRSRKRWPRTA